MGRLPVENSPLCQSMGKEGMKYLWDYPQCSSQTSHQHLWEGVRAWLLGIHCRNILRKISKMVTDTNQNSMSKGILTLYPMGNLPGHVKFVSVHSLWVERLIAQ